jgi:hypothetical protein
MGKKVHEEKQQISGNYSYLRSTTREQYWWAQILATSFEDEQIE